MTAKGMVFDIRKFSVHDGPGIRTAVFLKGCPLRCAWCHNPESWLLRSELILHNDRCIRCGLCAKACPESAIRYDKNRFPVTDWKKCVRCARCADVCMAEARRRVGKNMTVAEVMGNIVQDKIFYAQSNGGVTFSGGEPLMQIKFLLELMKACKKERLHTALDTCGFAPWSAMDEIRKYTDLFLYDVKVMDPVKHAEFTGVDNRPILENLARLASLRHNIILRVPVVPGVNDDSKSMHAIAGFARKLKVVKEVDLLPYHNIGIDKYRRLGLNYYMDKSVSCTDEKVRKLAEIFRKQGFVVKIGG